MSEQRTIHPSLQIIEDAIDRLSVYKHPDLNDFEELVNPILKALGQGSLEYDRIEHVSVDKTKLHIGTTYSVRQCTQRGDYEIPIAVLTDPTPLMAATVYKLRQKLNKVNSELAGARQSVERLTKEAAVLETELQAAKELKEKL